MLGTASHTVEVKSVAQMAMEAQYHTLVPLNSCSAPEGESRSPSGSSNPRSSTSRSWTVERLVNAPSKDALFTMVDSAIIIT